MPRRTFWVVRNRRHQDYVYKTAEGVKLRFDSPEEAKDALEEAKRVYPREVWEITELESYVEGDPRESTSDQPAP